jgi:hypothetical protein
LLSLTTQCKIEAFPALSNKSTEGGFAMKKLGMAAVLFGLLFSLSCSSTPPGTDKVSDLLASGNSRFGQTVTVVGTAETRTQFSSEKLFKVFDGSKYIWVERNEETEEPPQGIKVRVVGTFQEKDFKVLGKQKCIEAKSVSME